MLFFNRGRSACMAAGALLASVALLHGESPVERGKYLVEDVAMCGDCHTPMVEGKADAAKLLKGSTLGFQPIGEVKQWHKTAPDLTPSGRLWQRWGEKGL